MNGSFAVPAFGLALFGFGVLAFQNVAGSAPAFVTSLQVDGITGDGRLQYTPAMYDRGAYLFQLGVGYVNADALSFGNIEAPDEVASFDVALSRATLAADLLRQSLAFDPSNAHAWTFYARAMASSGDLSQARDAIANSAALAPTTVRLATMRIALLDVIQTVSEESSVDPLTEHEHQIRQTDVHTVQKFWPDAHQTMRPDEATVE